MAPLADYTRGKLLHSTERSQLHEAVRVSDGAPVVLKSYLDTDSSLCDERARNEFECLRKLAGPGIPQAFDLVLSATVVVLERVPGVALAEWVTTAQPPLEAILDVLIEVAAVVGRVHAARVIHRDINPQNIVVDPASRVAHLIDFELARPLGSALASAPAQVSASGMAGTLRYMAPEQTGRMDRGIDPRSDLYSLGATLYFALTGHPPFESDDPLTLIHAHIARPPVPAVERHPSVPATLSRIASKLLQKSPEERYQTAHALRCDLQECRDQLRRTGAIQSDFPLGRADAPYRPLFLRKLYGREHQVGRLSEAYARAAAGAPVFVPIAGPPGLGKSALVDVLRVPVTESGGYLAQGKFDQYRRELPYAGFAQAFASLAQQMLTESDARLAAWRAELRAALGAIAAVLLDLVPELGLVLGEVPPVPRLGPAETKARLALAVRRLLQGTATGAHPLVLVLDDLQWADPASRELLRELLLESHAEALLVLGPYRDTEVDATHPIARLLAELQERGVALESLALEPLGTRASAEMLADALGRTPEQVRSLAECVARKTGNTPLLIQQFVYHMYDLGQIHFEAGVGWTWDDTELAAADIPDDAVALITAKIARLPAAASAMLELASCVGDSFDLPILAELTDRPRAEIEASLFALSDEGLIAPARKGFRFVHDRIREAAQARLTQEERAELHHRTAQRLLEHTPPSARAERAFEIADHLNHACDRLSEPERQNAVAINCLAGQRALAAGAAATAGGYFGAARTLFREADWTRERSLAFSLFDASIEAAYQMQELELAQRLIGVLEKQQLSHLERAQVEAKRIRVLLLVSPTEALERTLAALRALGIRWPRRPSSLRVRLAIATMDWRLRHPLAEDLFPPRTPQDPGWLAPILIISAGGAALHFHDLRLVFLGATYIMRSYLRHGTPASRGPGFALAAYTGYRITFLHHLRGAKRLAEAAEVWMERRPSPFTDPRARFQLLASIRSWLEPRSSIVGPLQAIAEEAREVGDLEFYRYSLSESGTYLALSGERLEILVPKLNGMLEQNENTVLIALRQTTDLLRSASSSPIDWDAALVTPKRELTERGVPESSGSILLQHLPWIQLLCVMGEFERALERCERVVTSVSTPPAARSYNADFLMFHGLCSAVLAKDARGRARRGRLRPLRTSLRVLRRLAALSPDTVHMAQLLEAEHIRLRGQSSLALRRYQEAGQRAQERGYRHHAALCYERRADLLRHLRRETDAAKALRPALQLYEEWGAIAKVRELERAVR